MVERVSPCTPVLADGHHQIRTRPFQRGGGQETARFASRGEDPIGIALPWTRLAGMNLLLLVVVLLLLFGGGGFYIGGPVIGGSALGLILLIALVVYFMGGFRGAKG